MNATLTPGCRLCGAGQTELLLDLGAQPIQHRFLVRATDAEPVWPLRLGGCPVCGLLQLLDPIAPEELYREYFTLSSWKRHPHLGRVLELLGARMDHSAKVLEIGSNDGSFLAALRSLGYGGPGGQGLSGFEPAQDAWRAARERGISTTNALFEPASARRWAQEHGRCGVLVCRHVLEHIADLSGFALALQTVLQPGAVVFFEVPDGNYVLSRRDYSALWEEHVNLWTGAALRRFLGGVGIAVEHEETAVFSGQARLVFGRYAGPAATTGTAAESGLAEARQFAAELAAERQRVAGELAGAGPGGGRPRIVMYGAGNRAGLWINLMGVREWLSYVVDDQPEKQGKFMPGSRLPVLPSEVLAHDLPDLVLLGVNAECEEQVVARHAAYRGRGGRMKSVLP